MNPISISVDDWDTAVEQLGVQARNDIVVESATTRSGPQDDKPTEIVLPEGTTLVRVSNEETGVVVLLPASELTPGPAERGLVGAALRLLLSNSVGKTLIKPFVGKIVGITVDQWERRYRPLNPRLYRPTDRVPDGKPAANRDNNDNKPFDWSFIGEGRSLLLLHDQLGQTHRSFAGMDERLHNTLAHRYEGRVWGFDHPTLGTDPTHNAQDLVALAGGQLANQPVDIIAIGRGGLVARELARLGSATLPIGSMAFIGVPNLGTPLADAQHLVSYINRLANLLALGPDPLTDIASAITSVLAMLVEHGAAGLPGIQALAPTPPLAADAFGPWRGPLLCIGSDYQPAAGSRVGAAFTNWTFDRLMDGDPNDLLVPLSSSVPSAATAAFNSQGTTTFAQVNPGVSHSEYWTTRDVATAIERVLLRGQAVRVNTVERPTAVGSGTETPAGATSTTGSTAPLTVGVRHASVEHSVLPVIVGHVQGSPMSGAEERLDRFLDRQLSELRMLNRYAGEIGDVVLVDNRPDWNPPRIAVIGLGTTGSLTSSGLTQALIPALIDLARRHADDLERVVAADPKTTINVGVAMVALGTSASGGLTIESSVRSALAAVHEAERQLATLQRSGRTIKFSRLEFIERYTDRVDLIAEVLERLRLTPPGSDSHATFVPKPDVGEGAAPGNAPTDREEVWRRLAITTVDPAGGEPNSDPGKTALRYTVMGRLARAEAVTTTFDHRVIEPLLANSIRSSVDSNVPRALFELLVPHELKGELATGENLHLLVDETTAYLPWELLTPRSLGYQEATPIALRSGALRQFSEAHARVQRVTAPANSALVIGNPPTDGYPQLPGAAREARAVASVLDEAGWAPQCALWDPSGANVSTLGIAIADGTASSIISTLVSGDWRVVHIAAHGIVCEAPSDTGVVLADGARLTADVFASMSIIPDLVFLNACHLGSIGWTVGGVKGPARMNELAAGVAQTLMRIGVRAVVAAGWAVDDDAAEAFATTLYDEMLSKGMPFGAAVSRARQAAHDTNPSSTTWGAYQCYGDPGFRLARARNSGDFKVGVTRTARRRQIQWISSIIGDRGRVSELEDSSDGLIKRLDRLRTEGYKDPDEPSSDKPSSYEPSSDELADLAEAYADLGEFDCAVECYKAALGHERATVSVRAMEQLGNLLVRQGRLADDADKAAACFDEAKTWLDRAMDIGPTGERHALLGSYFKKRAAVESANRASLVTDATTAYRAAHERKDSAYHVCMWVQMLCLGALLDGSGGDIAEATAAFTPSVDNRATGADFWDRAKLGDLAVTTLVMQSVVPDYAAQATDAAALYQHAFSTRSSQRERDSVIANIDDLAAILDGTTTKAAVTLRTALEELAATLRQWKATLAGA